MYIEEKTAIGIYSDSSLSTVEICLLKTDGVDLYGKIKQLTRPYPIDLKERILSFILKDDYTNTQEMKQLDEDLTAFHLTVFQEFYVQYKREYPKINLIGYSGHLMYRNATEKVAVILGNPQKLATTTGIPVIAKFIQSDLKAGGQGGPVFTAFYNAMTRHMEKPLAIVSLGGITTLTYIGPFGELQAFDVGIGTALLDYWIHRHTGAEMDYDGIHATRGKLDKRLLTRLLKDKFYLTSPPKTTDKKAFLKLYEQIEGCSLDDGATTITTAIAQSIQDAEKFLPQSPYQWILIGGGIHNPALLRLIKQKLSGQIHTGSECHWLNDTLNAQAYAFLAVRSLTGLPISYPQTTGVPEPFSGGTMYLPS
ncbi:MAG: anhydro-N-acetylmuramic acid kinase [Alphaproteobacteria bacterium]|nr:anhydro-N-acetylmuramic acid kinase [Alphaproteobacteria bacterium]